MDEGIDEAILQKVIRFMLNNRLNDSRDIEDKVKDGLLGLLGNNYEDFMEVASINIPDISLSLLKKFKGSYLVGGGENECLAEVRILLNTFNIRHKLVRKFIY